MGAAGSLEGAQPGGQRPGKLPWISIRFRRVKREQAAKRAESKGSRVVHQLLVWGALMLALVPGLGLLSHRWLPDWEWWGPAGLGVQLGFAALYLWGKRVLGRQWSGAITIKPEHTLVRSGPYRVVRHPLYLGILGMFVGTAVVWGEWHAVAGLGLGVIAYARKMVLEERQLCEEFGAEYEEYRRGTWALVPGVL